MSSILIPQQIAPSSVRMWAVLACVQAGFPSPAEDLGAKRIDVLEHLVLHPQATYAMVVRGDSMKEFGIFDRDTLLVDRAIRPKNGHIVVAYLDNDFVCKQFIKRGGVVKLRAGNATFPDIVPKDGQVLEIWGVVLTSIKKFMV